MSLREQVEAALTDDPEGCPVCDGYGKLLGVLGKLAHYRCRECGMDYSKEAKSEEV